MKSFPTNLPEVFVIEPRVFGDSRGFFLESFNKKKFEGLMGLNSIDFVQDNHSKSTLGVLRGLHYQIRQAQGKLIRVTQGEIFDVAIDLRKNSPFFGKHFSLLLSDENKKNLWVPAGFAHGFLVLSETAEVQYKTTDYYAPEFERTLLWNDPDLNIQWPLPSGKSPLLSDKDLKTAKTLKDAEVYSS